MAFKLFEKLDLALVEMEKRSDYSSRSARIWPSEASAILLEPTKSNIVGGCHRRIYYRLTGEKTLSQMDAVGARRVRTGKAVEDDTTLQAIAASIHIASGVRMHVPMIDLAFELDLIVLDPKTSQPVLCENKSIYGYMGTKEVIGNKYHQGKPKLEHLIQLLLYINEIRTGAHLKQVIAAGLEDKETNKRNRIRVTQENVDMVPDDSKVYGKLCYETRDTCETKEFDVSIYEDFDGLHYPVVDDKVWQLFTIESIYDRFLTIQGYFNRAQAKAIKTLAEQGNTIPAPLIGGLQTQAERDQKRTMEKEYWDRVGEEMRRLGPEFLPPTDFQYKYSDQKIELLHKKGLIGETKWKEWDVYKRGRRRKAGVPIIGDWQCAHCPYRLQCIPLQCPELAGICQDLILDVEEESSI